MQKIRIMTDSASDLPQDIADALGIAVLPIYIFHEGKIYREGIDLTNEEFYNLLLTSSEIPTTSHITEETYTQEYKKAYDEGCTHLLNITLNSLGSNIYNAACLAKSKFYTENKNAAGHFRIEVVDSKAYSMAYGISAVRAAEMARDDVDFDIILKFLDDWFDRLEILLSVYSLKFARKSGRIGCAAVFLGEQLGMRPMIAFIGGVPQIIDKVRGDKNVATKLYNTAEKRMRAAENYPFVLIRGTPMSQTEKLETMVRRSKPKLNPDGVFSVGASIAVNCGPKMLALVYAGEKRVKTHFYYDEFSSNVRIIHYE